MDEKIVIILLLNIIVYWRTLYYGYVGDDVERSQRKPCKDSNTCEEFKKVNMQACQPCKKPEFKNFIQRWHIQFMGIRHLNAMHAHFITLWIHTICCVAIYLCLGANNVSFLTAILFSINPINLQGSVWISGRPYVTSTFLTLLMIIPAFWFLGNYNSILPYLSTIPYYLTSFFSVNAWFAPLAFLFMPYWWMSFMIIIFLIICRRNRETIHRKIWETGPVKTTNREMRSIKPDKLIVFIKCYGYYFRICLFPYILGIDHKFMYGFGTNQTDTRLGYTINKDFWIGLICILLVPISYYFAPREVFWGLWWFTCNIAMWSNFLTIQQQISQRYCYLATVGMMFALSALIINYPILITAFIVFYLTRLWWSMPSYTDDYWAVEHCTIETKNFHYMWLMRSVKKFFSREFQGALYDILTAYKCKPYDFKVLYNISALSLITGNLPQAKQYLEIAKSNTYDEMEGEVLVPITALEKAIANAEEQIKTVGSGVPIKIDLAQVQVVK